MLSKSQVLKNINCYRNHWIVKYIKKQKTKKQRTLAKLWETKQADLETCLISGQHKLFTQQRSNSQKECLFPTWILIYACNACLCRDKHGEEYYVVMVAWDRTGWYLKRGWPQEKHLQVKLSNAHRKVITSYTILILYSTIERCRKMPNQSISKH